LQGYFFVGAFEPGVDIDFAFPVVYCGEWSKIAWVALDGHSFGGSLGWFLVFLCVIVSGYSIGGGVGFED
jgi:hypothetical protein